MANESQAIGDSEPSGKRLIYDLYFEEGSRTHQRTDWFLIFHAILLEAFFSEKSRGWAQDVVGSIGLVTSYLWLMAGVRQRWLFMHLGKCMESGQIMGGCGRLNLSGGLPGAEGWVDMGHLLGQAGRLLLCHYTRRVRYCLGGPSGAHRTQMEVARSTAGRCILCAGKLSRLVARSWSKDPGTNGRVGRPAFGALAAGGRYPR